MKRFLFAFFAAALCLSPAIASPVAPARGQIKGDIVQVNQLFHIGGFNVRVLKLEWVAADSAFVKGLEDPPQIDEGKGALVITATLKNTAQDAQELLVPTIQVFYKDATQSDEDDRYPRTAAGKDISGDYQPGQGMTVRYSIPNVPKPTADNPVTKILVKPQNAGDNDEGFPKVFRMLSPPVSAP